MCLVREGVGDTYFILQKVWSTHTQLYILLPSVASEKEDVGRVGLMALVLRAPASTRDRHSLEHRYSQLFPTSSRCKNTGWSASSYDSVLLFSRPRKDRTCDGQMDGDKKGKKEIGKKEFRDSLANVEKVLKPMLFASVVFHFSIRSRAFACEHRRLRNDTVTTRSSSDAIQSFLPNPSRKCLDCRMLSFKLLQK